MCVQLCPIFAALWTVTRLLCPWDSSGKNTGVGCQSLHQGILPTQRSNRRQLFPALPDGFFTTSATCGAHTVLYVYINGIDMTYVFTCYLYPLYIEYLTVCQILFQVLGFHQLMTPTKVPAFMRVISQQGETDTNKHNK